MSSKFRNSKLDNGIAPKSQFHMPVSIDASVSMDVEFIDPAIMAVGKAKRPVDYRHSGIDLSPPLSMQSGISEIDPIVQLLSRRPFSTGQNLGFSDPIGNGLSHLIDSLSNSLFLSSPASYHQSVRSSQYGNDQPAGLTGIQGSSGIDLLEIAKTIRFGFDNRFSSYDLRFCTPTSK